MSDSDSDIEFFASTQRSLQSKNSNVSNKSSSGSVVEYFFLVTFNWDLMVGLPFEINVIEQINDFPSEWIKGHLSNEYRQEKRPIAAFGGGNYSLFCKVEKGI